MADKLLFIDDDVSLGRVMGRALREAGYEVDIALDGMNGIRLLFQWQPDLVILDVMMPRMDGWETCRRIREVSTVPILMLTARGGEVDEVQGLGCGADLYMAKPFSVSVLLARVEALLRRRRMDGGSRPLGVITTGELQVDLSRRETLLAGRSIELTPTEFKLLSVLASRVGEVVSREELLSQVWGPEYLNESVYLKLYVRYLRQKLEEDPAHPRYILTRRGMGYTLAKG